MLDDPVGGSAVQMVREGDQLWVVRRVVPSLDQVASRILPVVAILGDVQDTLHFHDALNHVEDTAISHAHAVPVVEDALQFSFADGISHDLHPKDRLGGAEKLVNLADVLLDHASTAAFRVLIRS